MSSIPSFQTKREKSIHFCPVYELRCSKISRYVNAGVQITNWKRPAYQLYNYTRRNWLGTLLCHFHLFQNKWKNKSSFRIYTILIKGGILFGESTYNLVDHRGHNITIDKMSCLY